MNILFVNTFKGEGIYGIERWMLGLGRLLVHQGHYVGLAGRPTGCLRDAATAAGIEYFPLKIRSGLEALAVGRLRGILRRRRVDAMCVKIYKELRVAAWARIGLKTRLFQRRGAMGDVENTWKDRWTLTLCADRLIVPSTALKEEFSRVGWLKPERLAVLPHGVELEDYASVRPVTDLPAASPRVAYVGRLIPVKGTDVLLEAWRRVIARCPGARLLLVGASEDIAYDRMARELGIADTVDFVGFKDDVKPWLAAADVMVLPSREEGGGLVLIEAMALSKPVIASRVGGIADYVRDGETGVLVPPGNPELLADALCKALQQPERLRRMGLAGRARVEKEFSLSSAARKFLDLIGNGDKL